MTLRFIKQLHSSLIILLTESDEDEGEYIAEDRETKARRNRKTVQRVQTAILQNLRQSLGAAATLPEEAAKDLILQVTYYFYSSHQSSQFKSLFIFLVIIHFFFFFFYIYIQGICRIQMGCKLQEAAAKYQYEGFSRIYIACAGMDTQKLIDLLETMFGEMDRGY